MLEEEDKRARVEQRESEEEGGMILIIAWLNIKNVAFNNFYFRSQGTKSEVDRQWPSLA